MSKKRVSSTSRRPRRSRNLKSKPISLKVHHFLGVALAGGKTDKTCLATMEYYPAQNKIFLSRLFEKIGSHGERSGDSQLQYLISQSPGPVETIGFDVPTSLPKCMRCRLRCPGVEACTEPEIAWMWEHYRRSKKKNTRLFTPYTERSVEMYLSNGIEEPFHLPHALGANVAPLTARAMFVAKRVKTPIVEVYPRLSLWRLGRSLNIGRSHLMFHKHAVGGDESRSVILNRLVDRNIVFLYEQDRRLMVENNQAFEAFLVALTGVLNFRGQCEGRPKDFPKSETWITIPKVEISW